MHVHRWDCEIGSVAPALATNITKNLDSLNLPETDVVLKGKLDPIDNLWDLWDHSDNCYAYEILRTKDVGI